MNKMHITAFVGSARKGNTYHAVQRFLLHLQSLGTIDYEIVPLSDYRIEVCRGCKLCMDKGEELCPLKDDRDLLIDKMQKSDGVIFATPNYAFQVSGLMKIFLDRIAFFFHRPRFFGKTCTGIVSQGIYGGTKIVKYLDFIGKAMGFNVVKGRCFTALEPISDRDQARIDRMMAAHARAFHSRLVRQKLPRPGLFDLMIFRMSRTKIRMMLDENSRDYTWYRDTGWFESDFYYPVRLGPVRKGAGKFFDWAAARMSTNSSG